MRVRARRVRKWARANERERKRERDTDEIEMKWTKRQALTSRWNEFHFFVFFFFAVESILYLVLHFSVLSFRSLVPSSSSFHQFRYALILFFHISRPQISRFRKCSFIKSKSFIGDYPCINNNTTASRFTEHRLRLVCVCVCVNDHLVQKPWNRMTNVNWINKYISSSIGRWLRIKQHRAVRCAASFDFLTAIAYSILHAHTHTHWWGQIFSALCSLVANCGRAQSVNSVRL